MSALDTAIEVAASTSGIEFVLNAALFAIFVGTWLLCFAGSVLALMLLVDWFLGEVDES